ncbi:hypothetical protein BO83DRAFT_243251 [Aspergillus eucalypticola CBS 122712]|uniref:Uncharacterized protein n=1 Tax=Aspergillus eucalypticola (strain CBS 122712 / IBT 29274) TaxID=1448314 RepID=A0A317VMG8_ASPEC|nr:uncharacterized protein BO83DRAFT_243251 [Aspergillus eucalypticola CBS 122712]PWY75556.1 hypothetical protein BO83DRAFT_243251 [Aspergillus eucalypticola CBS 122712]
MRSHSQNVRRSRPGIRDSLDISEYEYPNLISLSSSLNQSVDSCGALFKSCRIQQQTSTELAAAGVAFVSSLLLFGGTHSLFLVQVEVI